MKLMVEIPDEEYETVKKTCGCYYYFDFGQAIINGIPLPEDYDSKKEYEPIQKAKVESEVAEMKVVQSIELTEEERQTVIEFITLMNKINKIIPCKSVTDIAAYFWRNCRMQYGGWYIDKLHQINEIEQNEVEK